MKKYFPVVIKMGKIQLLKRIYTQKAVSSFGLYQGQLPILEYVINNQDCTQVEVSDKLLVTPASIALSTKRMEKAGLLEKVVDENNLRCKKLRATNKGIEAAKEMRKSFDAIDEKMMRNFSDEEIEQLDNMLDRILNNITENCNHEDIDLMSLIAIVNKVEEE